MYHETIVDISLEAQLSLSTLWMEGWSFILHKKIVMRVAYLYVLELYSHGLRLFCYFILVFGFGTNYIIPTIVGWVPLVLFLYIYIYIYTHTYILALLLKKILVLVGINIIDTIWYSTNRAWFNDHRIRFKATLNRIYTSVTITGNCIRCHELDFYTEISNSQSFFGPSTSSQSSKD
jgi:hypothetical protein